MSKGQGAGKVYWPERLKDHIGRLHPSFGDPPPDRDREEAWVLLHSVLMNRLRGQAAELEGIDLEDLRDIAAQKSLDLMRKAESGEWDLSAREAPEIARFIAKVARNGLFDLLRERGRRARPRTDDRPEWEVSGGRQMLTGGREDPPHMSVERMEFAAALRSCADKMEPRRRNVWIFRLFYRMSTKEIAAHPEISLKPGHVDVLLQRAREEIRKCMEKRGHDSREIPPGAFVELWKAFRMEEG